MSPLLNWIKTNLVIVVCSAVAVLGIAGLLLGSIVAEKMVSGAENRKRKIATISKLSRTQVTLPSSESGERPKSISKAITQQDVNLLKQLFEQMKSEKELILAAAVDHNRFGVVAHSRYGDQGVGHFPMLDDLFPVPLGAAVRINAKQSYRAAFRDMLGPYSPDSRYPNLDSGMPPANSQIQEQLEALRDEFLADKDKDTSAQLSMEDRDLLRHQLRNHAMKLLRERAESIHIYAEQVNPTVGGGVIHFPIGVSFDVGKWSDPLADRDLSIDDIWEGQMGLWIQQDVVEAIARINRVEDDEYNVMQVPVKRLVGMQVVKGYVGIDETGGPGGQMRGFGTYSPQMMGMAAFNSQPGETSAAAKGFAGGAAGGAKDINLQEDFKFSLTGRGSNRNFDIRHVKVTIVIDSKRIPEFFEVLSSINYMTVLLVQLQNVDEYEAIRKGFVYGTDDVVEMVTLLETVWLRKWTTGLMPVSVKNRMGMLKPGDEGYVSPVTVMPGGVR